MLSSVDIETNTLVAVTKPRLVSNGVSVSRLRSGAFAVTVHDGDCRAIIDLTADELREFAANLMALVEGH